ncbi:alpha/beta fold hydrolase [Agromyces aurantiacus]|uniref:Alpha/beta fold hydrolase n=1 Tax=Agromyces aurantiacus TaxID=165814 RepID=A0ABV9R1X2_9MICO|nr:alpha/beta hydrolase [Agromyces aurantiacus]MBM7502784.1 haloacetate dehalogenase [Agromyces aurantiacus]
MFDRFVERVVETTRGPIFTLVGGDGPALLLLHGYPQTHHAWHGVADALTDRCTVVVADLPGYGGSFRPISTPDHRAHSKRVVGDDLVEAMLGLGFPVFAVAGHDRGGRVAYRMALDHPERITAAAVFDVVPTSEVWGRADADLALRYWHWSFLAQPEPLPERLIGADPDAFFDGHVRALGLGRAPGRYPAELMAIYRGLFDDAEVVHAICEDYRAGAGVDRSDDRADRDRGRRIECPLLLLWSATGALPSFYGDVPEVWRPWARDIRGRGLDAGHFLVEDRPDEVAAELLDLMAGADASDRAHENRPRKGHHHE